MGRIRTIKPEFPQSESIGHLSRDARLLFIQLWTIADDSGRARASSRMLASLLYPYDEDARSLIDGWLAELDEKEMIVRYEHEGQTYLQISNWLKHQKIDKPSASKFPAFVESSRILSNVRRGFDVGPRTKEGTKDQGAVAKQPALIEPSLPLWLDGEIWKAWVEMRKKMRNAPFTERARRGILDDLTQLHEWGIDANQRLEEGIKRGWRGVKFDSDKPLNGTAASKTPYQLDLDRQMQERRAAREQAGL